MSQTLITPCTDIPTAADCHIERYDIEGVGESEIEFWDTAGQEALENLRFMAYPGTQVLLIAFDLTEPISLENVEHSWIEEFRDNCSDCPCTILVGTKLDRHPGRPLDESLTDNIQQAGHCSSPTPLTQPRFRWLRISGPMQWC